MGFVMCGCVYVWVLKCVGVCMCGCFDNCMDVLVICVLVFTEFGFVCAVFLLFLFCTFILIRFFCATATE
jgi:hypothetical protein